MSCNPKIEVSFRLGGHTYETYTSVIPSVGHIVERDNSHYNVVDIIHHYTDDGYYIEVITDKKGV